MSFFANLCSVAAKFLHRSSSGADLEAELRSHIEHRADDLERSGFSRNEAERRARIEFGGYEKFRQESHAAQGGNFLDTLVQDLRYSLRVLRKSPGFTVAAVATLALAIGANSVVFSVLNAVIIRPLNVPEPQSLYELQHGNEADGSRSYPDYLDLRERNHSFEDLVAWSVAQIGWMDSGGDPVHVWAEEASENYFDALHLQPSLGRFFHAADDHGPNSAPYVVLNYAYWQNHFQGDRSVVGRIVQVNKYPFTIIGVAPPGFHGTLLFFNPDIFVPLVNDEQVSGVSTLNDRSNRGIFMVMGHLKTGVTQVQAIADLNSIGSWLERTYPKVDGKTTFTLARPSLYGDYLGRPTRAFLAGLMLLSGLILLAACANLGSLFAARAADRGREVALRLALGSSRRRILRSLFTEAILISLAGGAFGLLGSVVLLRSLSAWQPFPRWPIHLTVTPDATVYGVALLLTLASGLLFGAVPVRQILRTNPYEVVKAGLSGRAGRRINFREILLVLQIAICAVLVTSSFVAVRSLARSLHSDFGFDLQNVMLADTDLSMAAYKPDQIPAMQKRMIDALKSVPGVETVGLIDSPPLGDGENGSDVFADSTSDLRPSNAAGNSFLFKVSPEYFRAAGTPLLSGRAFTWHDHKDAPRVGIVNQQFARKIFGSEANALNSHYKMPDGSRIEVVGIAEDGKYASLNEDPQPAMFLPILQSPSSSTYLVVRSKNDPQQLASAIGNSLRNLDAGLPVDIRTRYNGLDTLLFGPRMATAALGVMGVMGAMLAITGIFGMAAYSVSKRLRELGIRMALGAQRREVLQAALERPLKLLAFGSAAGLLLGLLATKVLAYIVYQATPRDPVVMAGVVLAMALLGLVATWIPAQRALSVNPMNLLREE
jgi:predicted permease